MVINLVVYGFCDVKARTERTKGKLYFLSTVNALERAYTCHLILGIELR